MKFASSQLTKDRGKWRGQLKYKDAEGKWRKKTKTLAARGKREAQKELEAWRDEMEAEAEEEEAIRTAGGRTGETVAEYVARYIDSRAGHVEPSTLTGYRTLLRNSIAPAIGDVPLRELTTDGVEAFMAGLAQSVSRFTANKALVLLRSALSRAHARGIIPSDPTATVEKLKERSNRPNSLSERERGKVAAYVDIEPTAPLSVAVRLALYTGMRRGEICGLRWKSVDVGTGTLKVVESLGIASGKSIGDSEGDGAEEPYKGVYVKEPKTRGSMRTVSYPASVADALRRRRAAMKEQCLAAGVPFSGSLYVCGDIEGHPLHPTSVSRRWGAVVTALDLMGTEGRPPTFHDLRHTYATTAIAAGVDVKTVSSQMGHANAAMTLNTYASPDPDAARRAAEAMDEAFGRAKAKTGPAEVIELGRTGTDGR